MALSSPQTLQNVSLKTKILVVLSIIFLVMSGSLGFIDYQLMKQTPSLDQAKVQSEKVANDAVPLLLTIKDIRLDVVQIQQWFQDISATRGQDGLDDGFKEAQKTAENFKKNIAKASRYAEKLGLDKITEDLARISKRFIPYYETGKEMARRYVAEGPAGGNKMMASFDKVADELNAEVDHLLLIGTDATTARLNQLSNSAKVLKASNESTISMALTIAIMGLLIVLFGAVYLFRFVKKNFDDLLQDVEVVSNNDVETPLIIQTNRTDEFGILAGALASFRKSQREILIAEQQKAQQRHLKEEKRAQMEKLIEAFTFNIGGITSAVSTASSELNTTAQSMATVADQTSGQAATASTISDEVSANVQMSASAAEELSKSISEINQQVMLSTEASQEAVSKVEHTTSHMEALAKTAKNIGEVVGLISDIADQTNLLALNATIESARAGEAGKGFAVVANEVKGLASKTAKATIEIVQQVEEIQQASNLAVVSMDDIAKVIDRLNETASAIAAAIEEQGAATQEIARNVQEAASGTQEVTHNIDGISEASAQAGEASSQVLMAAGELFDQAKVITNEVDQFIDQVRQG